MTCSVAKCSKLSLGFAIGLTEASAMALFAWAGAYFGYGMDLIHVIASAFLGYGPSFVGGLIGAAWGFVDGFIFGWLIAWIYNLCLCCCVKSSPEK